MRVDQIVKTNEGEGLSQNNSQVVRRLALKEGSGEFQKYIDISNRRKRIPSQAPHKVFLVCAEGHLVCAQKLHCCQSEAQIAKTT